jgi:RodZ C-terminal domain
VIAAQQVRRLGRTLTTVIIFGLAAYIWSFNWQRLASPPTTTPAQPVAPAASDVARASDNSAAPPQVTPSAAIDVPQGPLQFELRPEGPCWLVANVDGTPVLARLLQRGESQTIEVHDELLLRVGDPAALSYSINGQTGRPLGRQGEPVNVRITRSNFRDFLSS